MNAKNTAEIRLLNATREHIPAFMALQAENLLANLPADAQGDGFVTTPFTDAHLHHLIDTQSLFLAFAGDELAGYLACGDWPFYTQWKTFQDMVATFSDFTYHNTIMDFENSYQYGPVCVNHHWRGQGILPKLYAYGREQMAPRYPYALTFINKRNARSFAAHTQKLQLDVIHAFTSGDQQFYILGFPTRD